MDLNKLQTFYTVTLQGGFQQASKVLGIHYTSISRQIKTLEKELGCPLVKKYNRGVTLTPQGQRLFAFAAKFLNEAKVMGENIKNDSQKQRERIKIVTTQGIAAENLPRGIKKFVKLFPHIYIEISTTTKFTTQAEGNFDTYIGPINFKETGFSYHLLCKMNFSLYATQQYLKEYGHPKNAEDLSKHRLIGFSVGENRPFSDTNQLIHLGSNDKYRVPHISIDSSIGEIILANEDLGIASIYDNHSYLKNTNLVKVFPSLKPLSVEIFYVCRKSLESQPVFQDLYKTLKNYFQSI